MVAQNIFFGLIAAVSVIGALRVVTTSNVVHAALWLVVALAGVGGSFILVGAEFTGLTQVLVYIGAIVVLFLFGIMLTRAPIGVDLKLNNRNWPVALLVAIAMLAVLSYSLLDAFGDDELPEDTGPQTTAEVADSIFADYLIPFEVVSVLLLAALVGAIVLARKD